MDVKIELWGWKWGKYAIICKWRGHYHMSVWGQQWRDTKCLAASRENVHVVHRGTIKAPREWRGEGRVCGHVSAAPVQSSGLLLSQETGNYNWTSPGLSPKPASVRARGTQRDRIPQSPEPLTHWRKRWPSFAQLFLKVGFIIPLQCTDAFSCQIRAAGSLSAVPRSARSVGVRNLRSLLVFPKLV